MTRRGSTPRIVLPAVVLAAAVALVLALGGGNSAADQARAAALSADRNGLDGASLTARLGALSVSGTQAHGPVQVVWRVPAGPRARLGDPRPDPRSPRHSARARSTVFEVGLQRNHVTDVAASASALAAVLGLDRATLAREVRGAGPREFVLAETLRSADYDQIAARLRSVPE